MKSFGNGLLEVDYEKYLGRHDVVYLSPPSDGYEGMHIGNGDMGAMVWTGERDIVWAVNKCDLWDDGPNENFGTWSPKWEETATCLRSACRLAISNGLPSHEVTYLEDYEARLDLHKATMFLRSVTPFSNARMESFVDADTGCLVVVYEDETDEETQRCVTMSRWGSRVYAHWYRMLVRDPKIGLNGTDSKVDGDIALITQETRSLSFAIACRAIASDGSGTWERANSRELVFRAARTRKCRIIVYLSVVTSEEADDFVLQAAERVRRATQDGVDVVRERHHTRWDNYWSKSFVDIPDKYIENLWYLNLYTLGSSSNGKYPPNNNTGIWTWNHDFRPWNHYYHWNNQYLNWPVYAAGHSELAEPYLKMRFDGLANAKEDARQFHNSSGSLYADVFNRRGYQDPGSDDPLACPDAFRNLTPGAQVGFDCWRHYRYTGDEVFLKEIGYPIMSAACQLYLDLLERGADGRYHLPASHPYEHPCKFLVRDSVTDISAVKALFPVTAQAASKLGDAGLAAKLNEVVTNLVDYELIDLPECYMARNRNGITFKGGFSESMPVDEPLMICAGRRVSDDAALHTYLSWDKTSNLKGMDPCNPDGGDLFPAVQDAPIFPFGVIGLKDRGTVLFSAARTTALATWAKVLGLSLTPITFARLGMAEEAVKCLDMTVRLYQQFRQGFWTEYPVTSNVSEDAIEEQKGQFIPELWAQKFGYVYPMGSDISPSIASTDRRVLAKVINSEDEWVWLRSRPLMHFLQTPGCVVQMAINEMLLQSYDGVIRVAPAILSGWKVRFALVAEGGLTVAAGVEHGRVEFISIDASRDWVCRVANPWSEDESKVVVQSTRTGEVVNAITERDVVEFSVKADDSYLLRPEPAGLGIAPVSIAAEHGRACPRLGHGRWIGIEREF